MPFGRLDFQHYWTAMFATVSASVGSRESWQLGSDPFHELQKATKQQAIADPGQLEVRQPALAPWTPASRARRR